MSYITGTIPISLTAPYTYIFLTEIRIGYARCSTDCLELAAQQEVLVSLGVSLDRICTDKGLTGSNRQRPGRDQALAAVRQGDTLVVPKLDRLARSVSDARKIADALQARGVKLAFGTVIYDPADPMGKREIPGEAAKAVREAAKRALQDARKRQVLNQRFG